MTREPAYEGWAIVELFGHRVIGAWISEVSMFGETLAKIDTRDTATPPLIQFYGGKAIYCFTPCTEEQVRKRNAPYRYQLSEARTSRPDPFDDDHDDDGPIATNLDEDGEPIDTGEDTGDHDVACLAEGESIRFAPLPGEEPAPAPAPPAPPPDPSAPQPFADIDMVCVICKGTLDEQHILSPDACPNAKPCGDCGATPPTPHKPSCCAEMPF